MPVQEAAAKHGATVVIGLHELDSRFSGTTLFNTVVVIGSDGSILNRHRKLMPTNPERLSYSHIFRCAVERVQKGESFQRCRLPLRLSLSTSRGHLSD